MRLLALSLGVAIAFAHAPLSAQYAERPALAGSGDSAVDASGRSVKNKRIRAIHTENRYVRGGTAWFFDFDPFLAYQLGRNLNFREFRERDGTFDATISGLGGPMPDGTTAKITTNNQTSCVGCHNLPQGNPGGGANFHKDSGLGRNSPHYYGGGVMEMLALQIRAEMLDELDQNGDGWVNVREANASAPDITVPCYRGGPLLAFGDPQLDNGTTGSPKLNNIFRVWYVDDQGRVVPGATAVDGTTTFGYNFEMVFWGFGQGPGRAGLNPTNRAFLWDPWKTHGGLESHDPTTLYDPEGDGVSAPSLAGAIQFPITHRAPDSGQNLDPLGFSRDDPDGDGHLTEISEGDLDLAEWFMLNAPRPAFAGSQRQYDRGVGLMQEIGCADCHVPRWDIEPRSSVHAGDRRFFDLDVRWNNREQRLEGRLDRLFDVGHGASADRRYDGFQVDGIFTDFRHHEMGEGFAELDFGGNVNTLWRTPPLWGVGSGFPWGHDGHSLTLRDVIERHGGEASDSMRSWSRASRRQQERLIDFLSRLVLYDIESLPADIDGDGQISDHYMVAGMDTGTERFNAEWLFRRPVKIQGPFLNTDGVLVRSDAATNIAEAYGENLPLREDSDGDGWPDVWDHAPNSVGYKDGVNN